jgi:hypothetical protein
MGVNSGAGDMDFDEDRLVLDDAAKVSLSPFVFRAAITSWRHCLALIIPYALIKFSALEPSELRK